MSDEEEEKRDEDFQFFDIDETNLDQVLFKHSGHVARAGAKLALAKKELSQAITKRKRVAAEEALQARSDPDAYGITGKGDVKAYEAAVEASPILRVINERIVQLEYKVDCLQAVMVALKAREASMSELVKLHHDGYWSASSSGGGRDHESRTRAVKRNRDGK